MIRDGAVSRDIVNGRLNLDLPITSKRRDVLAFAGDLSANANVSVDHLSDFGTLTTIGRSEEHTSELQSLMRLSYAVFCLKKKTYITTPYYRNTVTNPEVVITIPSH